MSYNRIRNLLQQFCNAGLIAVSEESQVVVVVFFLKKILNIFAHDYLYGNHLAIDFFPVIYSRCTLQLWFTQLLWEYPVVPDILNLPSGNVARPQGRGDAGRLVCTYSRCSPLKGGSSSQGPSNSRSCLGIHKTNLKMNQRHNSQWRQYRSHLVSSLRLGISNRG